MTSAAKYALLSVSDKTGVVELAKTLHGHGYGIVSSGGTFALLRKEGVPVQEASAYTGYPEMMDGRLKTLHPKIHGGLLAVRGDAGHEAAMREYGFYPFDVAVVNLYPFEQAVAVGADDDAVIEQIDIGGPSMIRSAAKNHASVTVIVEPGDYPALVAELDACGGRTTLAFRRRMAAKAFRRTAAYDAAIQARLSREDGDALLPERLILAAERSAGHLRYGENPHQRAAFYTTPPRAGIAGAEQLHGKQLSYNNIADADAALRLAAEFDSPAAVIVKHANPCGAATGKAPADAYRRALECDPTSAFGGIVALNRPVDEETASELSRLFFEAVIAPDFDAPALAKLAEKKNIRLLKATPSRDALPRLEIKTVSGGWLVQESDAGAALRANCRIVTKRAPTDAEWEDMLFAFAVAKHVRSNAIVLAKHGATVGVGAGQMSRVDAADLACRKAGSRALGASLASDAFFPFADGLEHAARAGVTAAVQPGGSVRDAEVVAMADAYGMAMAFTGMRSFKH
jgi:phosphoribosylaminoimidazolecarboxamide formyltransferase/IMP cyclohydrolase